MPCWLGPCRFVWGRGALDLKFSLAALLEALSSLVQESWQPERTLMLAIGHDEEVMDAERK